MRSSAFIAVRSALLAAFAAAGLAGCMSAKVANRTVSQAATTQPQMVYVGDFDLGAAFQSDTTQPAHHGPLHLLHHDGDPAERIAKAQRLIVSELVNRLNRAGLQATALDPAADRPASGWLVTGEFLVLNQGNRLERAAIGFGAGDSEAKLYVALADLAHPEGQNLLDFNTDSAKAKTPGGSITAIATHSPWGMVTHYALDGHATEKDIKQVAAAIADQIVQFAGGK